MNVFRGDFVAQVIIDQGVRSCTIREVIDIEPTRLFGTLHTYDPQGNARRQTVGWESFIVPIDIDAKTLKKMAN